jgi:hypothetical protein
MPAALSDIALSHFFSEQRAMPRSAQTLPMLIVLSGKRYKAEMRNLSMTGAMIVTSAPLTTRSRIDFHCGTICGQGIVLWHMQSDFGIKFKTPISERQLSEQISRTAAVASRQAIKSKPSIVHVGRPPTPWTDLSRQVRRPISD